MDEDNTNPAQAEKTSAAKPRAARKPAVRKKTTAAEAAPTQEKAPAAKPVRKPRTRKTTSPADSDAPTHPTENVIAPPVPATEPAPEPKAPAKEQESASTEKGADKPRVRRISVKPSPRTETAPVPADEKTGTTKEDAQPPHSPAKHEAKKGSKHETADFPSSRDTEPMPFYGEVETVGGNEGGNGNSRRKRRRNRRRGNDIPAHPSQQVPFHNRIDTDELVRRAWKIYLGEVTEEGLALMDDRTAKEAATRAFAVAKIFLAEAARFRPAAPAPLPETMEAPEGESDVAEAES